MSNKNKKQIVFIEPKATVNAYRIARSLKLTEKYETVLVSFSEVNREFFGKAYDKILILELSHKLNRSFLKTSIDFFKKVLGRKGRDFFKKIKKMKPYIFQITGPDLFSLMAISFLKENQSPKIYYSNDLWGADQRNFFFTRKFWVKGEAQKFFERECFKRVDGVINKNSLQEFELLNYKINVPKIALTSGCLDEWTFVPKKKKNKEIHIAYAGSPNIVGAEEISFMEVIKIITSQKIYFHTYGSCSKEKDDQKFSDESKKNKYYIKHKKISPYELNKEMSRQNYGIFPEFLEQSKSDSNPTLTKTQLASKMINYLEAGLPILVNKQDEYMLNIIEKYGLGFGIELKDLKNLREILQKIDYRKLQENIRKYQEEFKLSKKIREIEEFYDKIVKMKK